jgi:hypothetical protein
MEWASPEVVRDAGESAKTLDRPGVAAVLEAVKRGEIERIVIAKLESSARRY